MNSTQKLKRAFWEWLTEDIKIIPRPSPPILTESGKETKIMLNYKMTLPSATDPDVVSWNLETTLGSDPPVVAPINDGDLLSYEQGTLVSLRLQEVDDAGNISEFSDPFSFTATDTLPPSKPGQPVLELVSET